MNTSVAVTGMTAHTKVSSNLMVAEENNVADESQYDTDLDQTVEGTLMPVSSIDGIDFYYTAASNVSASGDSIANNLFTEYSEDDDLNNAWTSAVAAAAAANKGTSYDAAFNTAYSNTVGSASTDVYFGYIDYVFYIKGTNAESSNKELRMTKCNLLYGAAALPATERAWRVAVFSQDATKGSNLGTSISTSDRKTILARPSAVNFSSGQAVDSETDLGSVTYGTGAVLKTVGAGVTTYQKVTVRLWLEGEDNTCNNDTFANLTSAYTLDLEFAIDEVTAAVTTVGSVAA